MANPPHLHVHDYFSTLDGVPSPDSYLELCDKLEIPAIAFTNHGNLSSHAQASIESGKYKTKVILGVEAYVSKSIKEIRSLRKRNDEESKNKLKKQRSSYHVILLAKNKEGYGNLIKLNNISWTSGFYYRNRIDFSLLRKYHSGLVSLSACSSGILSKLLLQEKNKSAEKVARFFKDLFGEDFYLELQLIDYEPQDIANGKLIQLGKKLDIPFVLTNDTHFLHKGDHRLQSILTQLATKGKFEMKAKELFLKTLSDYEENFKNQNIVPRNIFTQAIDNTFKIADKCDYRVETGNLYFPEYNHKEHFMYDIFPIDDKKEFFRKMVVFRAKKILKKNFGRQEYRDRIRNEYSTIVSLGGIDYFLIVDDLLHFIRQNKAFTVIRGSANGSLIAFVLEFGLIDPIRHSIMFERFISKYRSLNDIDIDIDVRSEFRTKAVEYLKNKYGDDRVISIGTYNRMQLKGAIKDITRVFKERLDEKIGKAKTEEESERLSEKQSEYLFPTINRVTSIMEGDLDVESARRNYEIFSKWYDRNKRIMTRYIEPVIGNIKNVSLHPAGVVITPRSVNEILPIRTQVNPHDKKKRIIATAWENSHTGREDLNEIGVMTLDILGVKTLSIVSEVMALVKKSRGININLSKISLEDEKTLDMFNRKELIGVFQFSGGAATQIVDITKITEFNDLIVINALARPGALGAGAERDFAERKRNPTLVKYDHHSLKKILGDSLGVLVFSEHILRTASEFAGMPLKEADSLRKIIKSKNLEMFNKYKSIFIKGAAKKWRKEKDIREVAKRIWNKFSKAGNYLFPRGHAASYALLGYICQYLKVHYPVEFFTCHLRYAEQKKYGKIRDVARDIHGIEFIMPSVLTPCLKFEATQNSIRWPLTALKNVGSKAVDSIVANVPYSSFEDFYKRTDKRACNKRVVINMIIAGVFSEFGNRRAIINKYIELRKDKNKDLPPAFSSKSMLASEMENIYGFELESIEKMYREKLKPYRKMLTGSKEFLKADAGEQVVLFGRVEKNNPIVTKKGDKMAFCTLKGISETYNITLFPKTYEFAKDYFKKGNVVVVSGKKNIYNGEHSLVLKVSDRGKPIGFKDKNWAIKL